MENSLLAHWTVNCSKWNQNIEHKFNIQTCRYQSQFLLYICIFIIFTLNKRFSTGRKGKNWLVVRNFLNDFSYLSILKLVGISYKQFWFPFDFSKSHQFPNMHSLLPILDNFVRSSQSHSRIQYIHWTQMTDELQMLFTLFSLLLLIKMRLWLVSAESIRHLLRKH